MTLRELRSSNKFKNILSQSPSDEHLQIKGSKLPTHEQVLLCFLANLKKLKDEKSKVTRVKWEAAKKVVAQVLIHYNKAGIKTKDEKNMAKIIEQLYADFQYVLYHPGPKKRYF